MALKFVQIGKLFVQIGQMSGSNLQAGLNVNCSLWMLLMPDPSAPDYTSARQKLLVRVVNFVVTHLEPVWGIS